MQTKFLVLIQLSMVASLGHAERESEKLPEIHVSHNVDQNNRVGEAAVSGVAAAVGPLIQVLGSLFGSNVREEAARRARYGNIESPPKPSKEELRADVERRRRARETAVQHTREERKKKSKEELDALKERFERSADSVADQKAAYEEEGKRLAQQKARREEEENLRSQKEEVERLEQLRIQQGGYSDNTIAAIHKDLSNAVSDSSELNEAMRQLDAASNNFYSTANEFLREQLRPIINEFFNDQGLVRVWVKDVPWARNISFRTAINSREGERIRTQFNKALRLLRLYGYDPEFQDKAEFLLQTVLDADRLLGKVAQENGALLNEIGQRRLKRAERLMEYLSPGSNVTGTIMRKFVASREAMEAFDLEGIDSKTAEGFEVLSVATELARRPAKARNDDMARFHATSSLLQAKAEYNRGAWKSTLLNVDRVWAVVDYTKGLAQGIYDIRADAIESAFYLVMHPIDSVQALYSSVANYERTFRILKNYVLSVLDQYDGYSVEEKGRLHLRIAAEVLSVFVPVGRLKDAAKLAKMAKMAEHILEKETRILQRIGNYVPAPKLLKAFPGLLQVDRKTPLGASGQLRKRWRDSSGNIYEWDYQHGAVEKFDKRGKHLGEFDSQTGEQLKKADLSRKIEP